MLLEIHGIDSRDAAMGLVGGDGDSPLLNEVLPVMSLHEQRVGQIGFGPLRSQILFRKRIFLGIATPELLFGVNI